ncbi:MAG: hypothetical protein JWR44_973 [Hymenobacter sp.]|jgi:hypothetical protein|nr:hypothetical protein [Hymenobacter sp.]
MLAFVGYGEALAAFGATTGQYVAAVGSFHAETEAVLVNALALRRLIGAFHIKVEFRVGPAKVRALSGKGKGLSHFYAWHVSQQ